MKFISKFLFGLAAVLFTGLCVVSCAREDVEEEDTALPAKESAIYKHLASHKKERTRSSEQVPTDSVTKDFNKEKSQY